VPGRKRKNLENSSNWRVVAVAEPKPLTPDWMLYQFLKSWTPDDIKLAIKKNVKIDFTPFKEQVISKTVEKILEWFQTYRPDLYQVLACEDGIRWLRMNVENALRIRK